MGGPAVGPLLFMQRPGRIRDVSGRFCLQARLLPGLCGLGCIALRGARQRKAPATPPWRYCRDERAVSARTARAAMRLW